MPMSTLERPASAGAANPAFPDLSPRRVRHPLRFRLLDVRKVQRITPNLVRITLGGNALEGFTSPGFDDHLKLFVPDPETNSLVLPMAGPDGPIWPEGRKPMMRDYTPRYFDAEALTLDIDFALHTAGPATQWAMQAEPGQKVGIGGPKGSFIVPTGFDGHLLIGDSTALPAISRRLLELPKGARAEVLLEVETLEDHINFDSEAEVKVTWVHCSGAADGSVPLVDALLALRMPTGFFHTWIGCESAQAKALRAHLVNECHANPKWIRASGYWRKGSAATHDSLDE